MKRVIAFLTVVGLVCGISYGQDGMPSNFEHLKCFQQLIGTWQYDGPALEDVEGVCKKGDPALVRVSYRWILDKNAIEFNMQGEIKVEGGLKFTVKNLIGWDAEKEQIIQGGLNSIGGHALSTVVYEDGTKTWITTTEGIDGQGGKLSEKSVVTLKDKGTYVYQALDRQGGFVQGDSPKYTYTRVKRTKPAKRLKQTK